VFGAAAVWFGWRVFVTDSMVRASFALLASLLNVGAIMILLFAEYLGVALFFMMAVEMTVMVVFMVAFMMNPAGLNPMKMVHQEQVAVAAGVVAFTGLALVAVLAEFPVDPVPAPGAVAGAGPEPGGSDTIRALGHELMGGSMMLMESVGVTLLSTMIGGALLASQRGRFGVADEGSVPPPLDPETPDPQATDPRAPGSPRATDPLATDPDEQEDST
jgi:NADH-quinone oxidoreductase subunit J